METRTLDASIRTENSLKPIADALTKLGHGIAIEQVPVDIIIYTKSFPICVERKTTNDFLRSIKDGTLIEQLRAMREVSDNCYILLEGSWSWLWSDKNKFKSHFNERSVVGFLDAVDTFGVKIVPVSNKLWTIWWLDKRLRELKGLVKKTDYKLRPSASKDLSPQDQAEYIAAGFPNLGPAGITEVKSKFSCLLQFLSWIEGAFPIDSTEVDISTRIKNLKPKWRIILEENWSETTKDNS